MMRVIKYIGVDIARRLFWQDVWMTKRLMNSRC